MTPQHTDLICGDPTPDPFPPLPKKPPVRWTRFPKAKPKAK